MLCLDETMRMLFIHKSSIRRDDKSLTMKTPTTNTGKIQKLSRKVREENVEAI